MNGVDDVDIVRVGGNARLINLKKINIRINGGISPAVQFPRSKPPVLLIIHY